MEIADILKMKDGTRKTAALAAWVQGLYGAGELPPVLVGGAALELYTGGAYTTGDLDFAGQVPAPVQRAMGDAGFTKEGRHWVHEKGQIFLEFPSSLLEAGARCVRIRVGRTEVRVLNPEALLVDRLRSLIFWRHREDGHGAFLLAWFQHRVVSPEAVRALSLEPEVLAAFESLMRLVTENEARRPQKALVDHWIDGCLK